MTHIALFDKKFQPKKIFTNGHLLLNSEKMSKSTGNFMGVDECIDKYGVHATRLTLATCGDFNEDANFEEAVANALILKLHNLCEKIDKYGFPTECKSTEGFNEELLRSGITYCVQCTEEAYEKMHYRDVAKYGFYQMLSLYDTYIELGGDENHAMLKEFFNAILVIMQPILNSLCNFYIKKYKLDFTWPLTSTTIELYEGYTWASKYIKRVLGEALKRKKNKILIEINKKYPQWKVEILKDKSKLKEISNEYKVPLKEIYKFINCKTASYTFNSYYILSNLLPYFNKRYSTVDIQLTEGSRGEPYNPFIIY